MNGVRILLQVTTTHCKKDVKKPNFFASKMNNDSLFTAWNYKHELPPIFLAFMMSAILLINPLFAQPLSLPRAVELALQRNPKIKQYQEKQNRKSDAVKAASGNFFPVFQLKAGYDHLDAPLQVDLSPVREAMIQMQAGNLTELTNVYRSLQGNTPLTPEQKAQLLRQFRSQLDGKLPPFRAKFKNQNFKTATIIGIQPLFLGGKLIAAKKFAGAEKSAALAELRKTQNDIIQETINRYLAVIFLKEVVKTRRAVLEGMRRHERDAHQLYKEGLIARYQLLQAKVAVAEARRNLVSDINRLKLAKTALNGSLGLPLDAEIEVSDSLFFYSLPDSVHRFIALARRFQPLLQLVKAKQRAADQKLVAERAEFLPQISAFGKYELYPQDLSVLEPRWVVGLQLKLTLFNGFKRYHKMAEAKHLKNEVPYLNAHLRRQVELWVNRAYQQMRSARDRFRELRADQSLASENLRLNEKRFHTGLGTSLEVIDARLSLQKAQIDRLKALYDYNRAIADLYSAAGIPQNFLKIWKRQEVKYEG